jgi:hypothetical protein
MKGYNALQKDKERNMIGFNWSHFFGVVKDMMLSKRA